MCAIKGSVSRVEDCSLLRAQHRVHTAVATNQKMCVAVRFTDFNVQMIFEHPERKLGYLLRWTLTAACCKRLYGIAPADDADDVDSPGSSGSPEFEASADEGSSSTGQPDRKHVRLASDAEACHKSGHAAAAGKS